MAMEFFEKRNGRKWDKALNYEEKPLRKDEINRLIHARFSPISKPIMNAG